MEERQWESRWLGWLNWNPSKSEIFKLLDLASANQEEVAPAPLQEMILSLNESYKRWPWVKKVSLFSPSMEVMAPSSWEVKKRGTTEVSLMLYTRRDLGSGDSNLK